MLDEARIAAFEESLRGPLLGPADPGYEEARQLYNGAIDKRPRLIARCADVADVMASVDFGRETGLRIAVRGGGHSGPGLGSCDDGLVVDLSRMKGIRVDAEGETVRVEPGCTQGDVDHATHPFGVAVPSGIVSTTGIAGLALGGGHGYLSRRYGLTVDHLLEADVVLADGRPVRASEDRHPDLLWALRGGGGNFGVVVSFLFRTRPVHTVHGGPMFFDVAHAREIMRWYRDFLPQAPPEMYAVLGLKTVPAAEAFPREIWGRRVCALVPCHCGDPADAEKALAGIRAELPAPLLDAAGAMPFPALQSLLDGLLPPGLQWHWKGDFVRELPDEAIETHLEHAARAPSELSLMHLYPIDGAVHRVASDETAWGHRDATWSMVIAGIDPDPARRPEIARWAREYWEAVHAWNPGGGYVNFMMDDEGEARVKATYGGNHARLREVKRRYDPENLFRVNQNIAP